MEYVNSQWKNRSSHESSYVPGKHIIMDVRKYA